MEQQILQFSFLTSLLLVSDSKLPKPKYRNEMLEALIAATNNETELDLSWKRLIDQDMEIIAYYAIQENQVKNLSYFINN